MLNNDKVLKRKEKTISNSLANLLSPMGIKFGKSDLELGENYGQVIGVIKYPQEVSESFLSRMINIPNSYSAITYSPIDNLSLVESLNNNIAQQFRKFNTAKKASEAKSAEISMKNSDALMESLTSDNMSVGNLSLLVLPLEKEKSAFIKLARRVQSIIAGERCVSRPIANLQKEALSSMSPMYASSDLMMSITGKVMPLNTVIGGFPFATSGLNDGEGYVLAQDINSSLVVWDMWKRGGDRVNSNITITGKSGTGKSTAIKHIMMNEFSKGTKILVIDPEREYKDMCNNFKGDWLNCAGGHNVINIFQIRKPPVDDEGDSCEGLNDLARHLNTLEVFFKLYNNNLTNDAWNTLKIYIIELYNKFGITFETNCSSIPSNSFPTFSDLFELLEKKEETPINATLKLALMDITKGGDSHIWNGHTSISTNSKFVVFDTKDLQDASDCKKATQYFNIVSYCWNLIERDRNEKVMLVCDEAYLMIDQNVPQTLIFLRNASKRIRKYGGSLAVIAQDVVDFLAPQIKQYGQALLTMPSYKLLFGTDTENLREELTLFDLTEREKSLLSEQRRGHAIFVAGGKRLHVNFVISDEELKYMGNAGGR